jgi:hypothetical protein
VRRALRRSVVPGECRDKLFKQQDRAYVRAVGWAPVAGGSMNNWCSRDEEWPSRSVINARPCVASR